MAISPPNQIKAIPPRIPIIPLMKGRVKNWLKPKITAIKRINSSMPCPRIMSGPAQKPFFMVSLIVMVRTGPGANAPERAIKNEVIKIPVRVFIVTMLSYPSITIP